MADMLQCPACDREFKSKSALTMHIKKEHDLSTGLVKVMADYGTMAPRPGGAWRPNRPLRAMPSGIPSIDYAIGIGGVPRGCIIEIYGPPACGKSLTALVFAAYAQSVGGLAGYVDAEHRLQATFAQLINNPPLDLDTLYYGEPDGGEAALNMTKDFVSTGLFDVWIVDSVHGCVPKSLRTKAIGDATMAELAKLMSAGCQVLEPIVSSTDTVVIFVNHVKSIPAVMYGKDWSKPGGSALDYYASVQLRVQPIAIYQDDAKRKIGHTIKVKVENSKVAAPFAEATYNIFYMAGKIKKAKDGVKDEMDGLVVTPGIDIGSCWFSVCEETGLIKKDGANKWYSTDSGESFGYKREVIEMLEDDCDLKREADDLVYGAYAKNNQKGAVEQQDEKDGIIEDDEAALDAAIALEASKV